MRDNIEAFLIIHEEIAELQEVLLLKPDFKTDPNGWHAWYDLQQRMRDAIQRKNELSNKLLASAGVYKIRSR